MNQETRMAREALDMAQFQRRLERQDDPRLVSLTVNLSWDNGSDSYLASDNVRVTKNYNESLY